MQSTPYNTIHSKHQFDIQSYFRYNIKRNTATKVVVTSRDFCC